MMMGLYFSFLRPPLLPEDLRYMSKTLDNIIDSTPELSDWLNKVFWVMGSYIFTTGLLTIYIALTSFRTRQSGAFTITAVSGVSSIGSMTAINFIIASDFRWILAIFSLIWISALILYRFNK